MHSFKPASITLKSISAESWYVTSYLGLARAELALGKVEAARDYHCQTLFWQSRHPHPYWLTYSLGNEALLCLEAGCVERAVEVYTLAERFPFVANSAWFRDVYGNQVGAAARNLPTAAVAAARARGASLDLWETARAMTAGCQPVTDSNSSG